MSSPAEVFESHRRHLLAVAYRMLGSVAEAEDAVQEAYLRWQETGAAEIVTPRAWLTTVVTRLCLDQLKSARHARTSYVGPWLPEPLLTADLQTERPARSDERIDELESLYQHLVHEHGLPPTGLTLAVHFLGDATLTADPSTRRIACARIVLGHGYSSCG